MDDMTGDDYKKAIERLGMSLVGSAEFFGVTDKSVRNWMTERHPIPNSVSMLLCLMIVLELSPLDVVQVEEGCVILPP
jgi:DNA-binding transcriptional regulator YiaG